MDTLVEVGIWVYNYATDFCLNMSYLLGIDYVTFGSVFFGFIMNGIILGLIVTNLIVEFKRRFLRNSNKTYKRLNVFQKRQTSSSKV